MKSYKLSKGIKENYIEVGNHFDKYNSKNPIVKYLINQFKNVLFNFIKESNPKTIHEIGCGEGYWSIQLKLLGYNVKASDFSERVIELAKENAKLHGVDPSIFYQKSIYDLTEDDSADCIICCEVLEHLEDPEFALQKLSKILRKNIILSVPREPLWRILNLMRMRYILDLGNTPGHIQHWGSSNFCSLVQKYFNIIDIKKPIPWTFVYASKKN